MLYIVIFNVIYVLLGQKPNKTKEKEFPERRSRPLNFTYMERQEIIERFKNLNDRKELVDILNAMKINQFGSNAYDITLEKLIYFSDINNEKRYHTFHIKKKNGKLREISAPAKGLRLIQFYLNELMKEIYTPQSPANGFTQGKSIATGALVHVGHNYVLNIDLSDFFTTVTKSRVWKRLTLPPFNFPDRIADVIANLCCIKVDDPTNTDKPFKYVLPQGAPTSPLLTNAVCDTLDKRLKKFAKDNGVHYTRYADDMSFSSMYNAFRPNKPFMKKLRAIIEEQHFVLNESKTRIQKQNKHQEVTGIVVNEKLNVSRKYVRDLRQILYIWWKYGYETAFSVFYPHYKREKGHIKKGEPIMENVVDGRLNFLKMVKGENDPVYKRLKQRFDLLRPTVFLDYETEKNDTLEFVLSQQVSKFHHNHKTMLEFRLTENNGVIGYCQIDNFDVWPHLSKNLKEKVLKNANGLQHKDTIPYPQIENLWITLCRHKGKNFWLISEAELHKNKITNIGNIPIPIDILLKKWEKEGLEAASQLYHRYVIGDLVVGPSMEKNPEVWRKKDISTKAISFDFDMEDILSSYDDAVKSLNASKGAKEI